MWMDGWMHAESFEQSRYLQQASGTSRRFAFPLFVSFCSRLTLSSSLSVSLAPSVYRLYSHAPTYTYIYTYAVYNTVPTSLTSCTAAQST